MTSPFEVEIAVDPGMYGQLHIGQPIQVHLTITNVSGVDQPIIETIGRPAPIWGAQLEDWQKGGGWLLKMRPIHGRWQPCVVEQLIPANRKVPPGLRILPWQTRGVLEAGASLHVEIHAVYACGINKADRYEAQLTEFFPVEAAGEIWSGTVESHVVRFSIESLDDENERALADLRRLDTGRWSIYRGEHRVLLQGDVLEYLRAHPTSWYAGELLQRSLLRDPKAFVKSAASSPSPSGLAVAAGTIEALQRFLAAFPDVPWSADGWMTIAAYAAYSKDFASAIEALDAVSRRWPQTDAARSAEALRAYLAQLGPGARSGSKSP